MPRKLSTIIFALTICVTISAAARSSATQRRQESTAIQPQLNPREIPPEMARRAQTLHAKLQPSASAWVEQQAKLESQRQTPDAAAIAAAARHRFPSLSKIENSANGNDIEALVFIVLMQATNSAEDDLKQIMDGVKAINNAKQELRNMISQLQAEQAAMASSRNEATCQTEPCRALPARLRELSAATASLPHPVRTTAPARLTSADLKSLAGQLKFDLDNMNEMSETTSLRLQMAMDRRSKFIEALSNIMKKINDTNSSILQNLK
jgi:hypothetical protein